MLSKSDIQSYLQCPRKLWLEKHQPELATPENAISRQRMYDGNQVNGKAREALGPNLIWPQHAGTQAEAVIQAAVELAASPNLPAVEFPMMFDDVYARADALIPSRGRYILRETKASTFPLKADKVTPGKPEDHHLSDVAIQAWLMNKSGLAMAQVELHLLDGQWRYPGGNDYAGLFRQLDVTANVEIPISLVPMWIEKARATLAAKQPDTTTGSHCSSPIPCQFHDHCITIDPKGPKHPIELLPDSAGKKLAKKLRDTKGYESILEPRPEELTGAQAALYRRIQLAHRNEAPILEAGSAEAMAAFGYPRYYFDFEAIVFAVPRWAGTRPYEQITFQWSCHIERAPGQFEHREFLDLSGGDPSAACIAALIRTIEVADNGPIFVYFATYERGRLKELGERHPEHAATLEGYSERIVDLLPLVRSYYYHPNMRGSFSIKRVLPTIAPDLDYENLESVQDGTGAQTAYMEAIDPGVAADRQEVLDRDLRIYCEQDTWAMVELAHFLSCKPRPQRPIIARP